MSIVPRGSNVGHSPIAKDRRRWPKILSDRRIVASGLGAFAAIVGLVRSLIDLFNHSRR